ncbi:MAG: EAL domain-containing protein [Acidobacteriota bacterium]|jgi:diguanylate cyclase (GGDEF)-like protein/PAS domain S-box-containing protein
MSLLSSLALVADVAATVCAVVLLHHLRDRRLAFFVALPASLAIHQVLKVVDAVRSGGGEGGNGGVHLGQDLTGLVVSVLVLLAVVFAGRSLAERQESQRRLRLETAYLEQLFTAAPEAVVLLDNRERVQRVNPEFERLFGYSADEAVGRPVNDLIAPDHLREQASELSFRAARGETINVETMRRCKDGSEVQVSILGTPIHTEDGQVALYGIYRDITVRKEAEAALRRSEERYALAASGAGAGLWDWDLEDDRVFYSPRWKEMLGYADDEIGSSPAEWLGRVHPEDRSRLERALEAHLEGRTAHLENEHRILHRNGTYPWMLVRGTAVRTDEDLPYRMAGSQIEVTERKLAEEQLRHAALHDGLTGLPNRTLFSDTLERAFERRTRDPAYGFAVLFLDLDRFKLVNDSLGHLAGDRVLQEVGRRLRSCLRTGDAVARLAGDEFIVFLDGVTDEESARVIAGRIQEALGVPLDVEGQEVVLTAGIGIVLSDGRYETAEEILRDADIAMYRTKADGGDGCRVFDPTMHAEAVARLKLETDLRRAVDREEFAILHQPVVELHSGRVVGFEVLVRWSHPDRGLVEPSDFIGTAEETGLILGVGEQVLGLACRQLRAWQDRFGDGAPFLSVNLSARQFGQPDFLGRIRRVIEDSGADPARLNLEITESALMEGAERHVELVSGLRRLGVNIHIDDFGTGYSSLSYLHRFAIQALKIDRSFVAGMGDETGNREIVESIVTLASNLGMDVIAEGVETADQEEILRRLQCPLAQGYYFSRPLLTADAEELLGRPVLRRRRSQSAG